MEAIPRGANRDPKGTFNCFTLYRRARRRRHQRRLRRSQTSSVRNRGKTLHTPNGVTKSWRSKVGEMGRRRLILYRALEMGCNADHHRGKIPSHKPERDLGRHQRLTRSHRHSRRLKTSDRHPVRETRSFRRSLEVEDDKHPGRCRWTS